VRRPRLWPLFNPRRVAVIGASERNRYAGNVVRRLEQGGFPGEVLLVNTRGEPAFGRATARTMSELDGRPDFAYVAVGADAAVDTVRECVELGVPAAVVVASGFAETGEAAGRARQQALLGAAAGSELLLCGPTCLGVMNVPARFEGFGGRLGPDPAPGRVGVVSQSGVFAGLAVQTGPRYGVGFSHVVSCGGEAALDVCDFVDYLVDDPGTSVVCAFVEQIRRPAEFDRVARKALAAGKPLVLVKSGRSEGSARMAVAHTGALTGPDEYYDAMLRGLGVIRCQTVEETLARAAYFDQADAGWRPRGDRLAILSRSGGMAGIAADVATRDGLRVPAVGPEVGVENPIELSNHEQLRDPAAYERVLRAFAGSGAVDGVLVVETVPQDADRVATTAAVRAETGVPVLLVSASETMSCLSASGAAAAAEHRLPVVAGIQPAVWAVEAAIRYEAGRAALLDTPAPEPAGTVPEPTGSGPVLGEAAARALLAAVGIAGPDQVLVDTPDAAADAAARLGVPVAVKVVSPALPHKSEHGLVALDVVGPDAVRTAADRMLAACARLGAPVDGILVQAMTRGVAELHVGVDCTLGHRPLLRVGAGGVLVELLAGGVTHVGAVGPDTARALLADSPLLPLLAGYRGAEAGSVDAVAAAVSALSRLAAAAPWLAEIEINPLVVLPGAGGVRAVDVLAVRRSAGAPECVSAVDR
jgi:acetate---CoA ligase (ADP-forming)